MELLVDTVTLRPYVFAFLGLFLLAGTIDLGWRRVLGFAGCVWPVAWLAEFSSTRTGIPFGLYQYSLLTRGHELYVADVPLMDSLSFTFLAYASFCLARVALAGRTPSRPVTAAVAGALMMALDIVIDPLAVRGDRWFLGNIFSYVEPGVYFGVSSQARLGRRGPSPATACSAHHRVERLGTSSLARSRVILRRARV